MVAYRTALIVFGLHCLASTALAGQFATSVPMIKKDTGTYYVPVAFDGSPGSDLMVDTGSDYVTINQTTFDLLERHGKVDFVKQVSGTMADGSQTTVAIYRISQLNIGCCCIVDDVEAAVFQGTDRQILGLSALKKVAPFALSLDPAHLILSECSARSPELAQVR